MSIESQQDKMSLPLFETGGIFRQTSHFRIVMDFKPDMQGKKEGQRFFIEPLDPEAEEMLELAAKAHNVPNFNYREVRAGETTFLRKSLRADFVKEVLLPLFYDLTVIPADGNDSIPSPKRMEECMELHPNSYTFFD